MLHTLSGAIRFFVKPTSISPVSRAPKNPKKVLRLKTVLLGCAAASIVAVIVSAAEVPPSEQSATTASLIRDGVNAYEHGDYVASATNLKSAQRLAPDNSDVALYLGLADLKQNNLSGAIAAWERYISLKPSTEAEKTSDLQGTVSRDLTILQREQNRQHAVAQIANEKALGPPDASAVAITYYRNLGSPELAPLQKGLTALVIADVSKVPDLKVVERDQMQALLDEMRMGSSGLVDPHTAVRVGHLLGAGRVVTGSYLDPSKDQMRIESTLLQSGTTAVSNQSASGPIVHFYDVEKQLSAAILKDLGHSEADLKSRGLWQAVQTPQTTNYNAFVAFSRGLDAKDKQDYAQARKFFQQALADDPSFSLALQELNRTPMAPMSIGEVASSVSAQAPGAAVVIAALPAGISVGPALPNLPTVGVISAPPPPPPPPPPPAAPPGPPLGVFPPHP